MNEKRASVCGRIKVFEAINHTHKGALYEYCKHLFTFGIERLLNRSFKTNDSAAFRYHTDRDNLLQMIYMIMAGYFEDDARRFFLQFFRKNL